MTLKTHNYKGKEYRLNVMSDLLGLLEVCPQIIIGDNSIDRLESFLGGITFAVGFGQRNKNIKMDVSLDKFEEWVSITKNNRNYTLRSFGLIKLKYKTNKSRHTNWFKWYHEYQNSA